MDINLYICNQPETVVESDVVRMACSHTLPVIFSFPQGKAAQNVSICFNRKLRELLVTRKSPGTIPMKV